jgi:para-aminobenzoate synthetase/4-amino-4-deoxychorismate lyase
VVSGEHTPSTNVWLYHKTTNRQAYDTAREKWLIKLVAGEAPVLDVLLWNEHGFVQEFTIGNIVAQLPFESEHGVPCTPVPGRGSSVLVTPPVDAGLLPGVARDAAVASGHVIERPLSLADLQRAEAVWLVNSVRGWVPVRLPFQGVDRALTALQGLEKT